MSIEELALTFSATTSWFKIQLLTTLHFKCSNKLILLYAPNKPVRKNAEYQTEIKSLWRNSYLVL